jgi:hypothetical protein
MNVLELCTIDGPYGKSDECAKLSIYDTAEWFILSDTTTVGLVYTFSAWIKSDAIGSLTAGESYITTTTEWVKYAATFTADDVNLKLIFSTPGTYYLYNSKLEVGNIATDWSPSPEDVDGNISESIAEMRQIINQEIIDYCDEFIGLATGSFIKDSEYSEFKETVNAKFSVQENAINMNFSVLEGSIREVDGKLESKLRDIEKNTTFDGNGMSISDSEGVYSIQVDNVEGVTIRKNGEIRSQLIDDDFYTGNIHVEVNERARFGNFAFIPRSDGSLSFLKVGG